MRKLIYISLAFIFTLASCNGKHADTKMSTDIVTNTASASEDKDKSRPEFEFKDVAYDFGEIPQGEKVVTEFTFRNIGGANLIISDAKGSCGCTVPSYPQKPIAPGEEGVIKVVFDSNGKEGRVHKTVTLIANTVPNKKVLAIKGNILTPNN